MPSAQPSRLEYYHGADAKPAASDTDARASAAPILDVLRGPEIVLLHDPSPLPSKFSEHRRPRNMLYSKRDVLIDQPAGSRSAADTRVRQPWSRGRPQPRYVCNRCQIGQWWPGPPLQDVVR